MKSIVIIILLLCMCFFSFFIYSKYHNNVTELNIDIKDNKDNKKNMYANNKSYEKKIKGIMYFDIDGTLVTAQKEDIESNMQICLDNNYAIGIITASGRQISDVCNGDQPIPNWMPKTLCKYMKNTNYITYNSANVIAGMTRDNPNFPKDFPPYETDLLLRNGVVKGYQMIYGQKLLNIKDPKQIVLFDDLACFIVGAKKINPNGTFVCAGNNCYNSCSDSRACTICKDGYLNKSGTLQLNNDLIKNVILYLK